MDAAEQYTQQNDVVSIAGLVVDAIKGKWEPSSQLKAPATTTSIQPQESEFTKWYEAARKKGIVLASLLDRDTKEIILYLPDGRTAIYTEMKQQYPLKELTL